MKTLATPRGAKSFWAFFLIKYLFFIPGCSAFLIGWRVPTPGMQRPTRRNGGSISTRPTRKRNKPISKEEREKRALCRAYDILGKEEAIAQQSAFKALSPHQYSADWSQGNGIILSLLLANVPQLSIRLLLRCGGYRINRILAEHKDPSMNRGRRYGVQPWHAATPEDLQKVNDCMMIWEEGGQLEDGYPCAHRRPRRYFVSEGTTWISLHADYAKRMNLQGWRVLSLERWRQYIRFYFPELRLTRTKEDLCDTCFRLDVELSRADLPEELRAELVHQKREHLEGAVIQRRTYNDFVRSFVRGQDPLHPLPMDLPDSLDSPFTDLDETPTVTVQVQAEDFGGGLALPFYGLARPSVDYYQSNLVLHNFVIADVSLNVNHIYFYDERAQGKGSHAMCSLRLRYHLSKMDQRCTSNLSLLDNCVGQNKSNAVLKFSAMLSLLLYKRVCLLYLVSGHSHMIADRVVAWMKQSIKGKNLYHPNQFVEEARKVKSIDAEFLDHGVGQHHFFVGWNELLDEHFQNMPPGFTANHWFEFENGCVTYRQRCDSIEATRFSLCEDPSAARQSLTMALFGTNDRSQWSMRNLKLPLHPGLELKEKKLLSLAKKLDTIPHTYRAYYPKAQEGNVESTDLVENSLEEQPEPVKRKVGRPRKAEKETNQPSIMKFFRTQ
jgi:hypothetical protein